WLVLSLAPPQRNNEGREGKNHERVERLEPGDRNFTAQKTAVCELIGPECNRISLLFIGRPEQADWRQQQQEPGDRLPCGAIECSARRWARHERISGQMRGRN